MSILLLDEYFTLQLIGMNCQFI